MSFRTDGFPLLATASAHGHVVVWNLKTRRAHALLRAAHDARVLSAEFLRGQPVLVTAGVDNAVKMWIFDAPDGSARLLRSRSGHSAPPTRVRFYGARGVSLLSAARDRALRHCSLIRDAQNCELSQGALSAKARRRGVAVRDLRLPVIGQFDASSIKERQWENILTCHDSERFAYTWKFEQKTIGKHKLCHPTERRGPIRAVALSACGNFGFVATECGHIDRFNMQSGSFRGTYCEKGKDKTAHSAAVVGLVSDSLNRVLVSASRDGTLRFWDFSTKKLLRKVVLSDPATHLIMHRDSELVAVATDALEVLIYDVNTRQLVRRFRKHRGRLTDLVFSADARWLLTACMDGGVRVFDLPSGRLIDHAHFERPPTSIAFSPFREFLVTSHVESVGLFLWISMAHFSNVFLKSVTSPIDMELPSSTEITGDHTGVNERRVTLDEVDAQLDGAARAKRDSDSDSDTEEEEEKTDGRALAPLAPGLVMYSGLPASSWLTLANLDTIKERNKPKDQVKTADA
eukprot:125157_1